MGTEYWLASRDVCEDYIPRFGATGSVNFNARVVLEGGGAYADVPVWWVMDINAQDSVFIGDGNVRPVVRVEKSNLSS